MIIRSLSKQSINNLTNTKRRSIFFIKLARLFSPINIFQPVVIKLEDQNQNLVLDFFSDSLKLSSLNEDLILSSESLKFILSFPFGFDTLTVNGCFEEGSNNGFIKSSKTLAIENLNNIGIKFNLSIFFNLKTIIFFIAQLKTVSKKQKLV